jgi:hypothetical protein
MSFHGHKGENKTREIEWPNALLFYQKRKENEKKFRTKLGFPQAKS